MKPGYRIKETLLDLFFPSSIYCISCNKPLSDNPYSLCKDCIEKIDWIDSFSCEKCGKPLSDFTGSKRCKDCTENPHIFTKGFSCASYLGMMSPIIKDFKFHDKSYYAKPLAHMIFDRLARENIHYDMIIPVPLHKSRKKSRGYNQSELLASHLSGLTGVPSYNHLLIRKRQTSPQNKLSKLERQLNIQDAFTVVAPSILAHQSILLVDDVYTTGSTADACSYSLKNSQCHTIYVATCCAGSDS